MATSYMNLSLPVPGSTAGPAYASMLVAALTTIDAHDHSPGKGVPVRTSGLYVDADLAFGTRNLTALRSARFTSQASPLALPTDLSCLYASGGELYYNDGDGNAVQLTSGGALNAASIGAIGGDYATSPGASLFYTSGSSLFSMESAAGVKAYAAHGPLYLYEPVASGKYARVKVPTGLAANYDLTLPAALPGGTKILTLDNVGQVAAVYDVDGTTLEVSSNALRVKDGGITAAKTNAVSAPTASRLVVRDASGRAQFADPNVDADAATKGWVEDTAVPTALDGSAITVADGSNWLVINDTLARKVGKSVTLNLHAYAIGAASFGSIATIPVGARPAAALAMVPCTFADASGITNEGRASVGADGVVALTHVYLGIDTGFAAPPMTPVSSDHFYMHVAFTTA
jgi:hypothetical protein